MVERSRAIMKFTIYQNISVASTKEILHKEARLNRLQVVREMSKVQSHLKITDSVFFTFSIIGGLMHFRYNYPIRAPESAN